MLSIYFNFICYKNYVRYNKITDRRKATANSLRLYSINRINDLDSEKIVMQ